MKDGFLGYQSSFMLDFVVTALVLIVPLLLFSLWKVKFGRAYVVHRRLQLTLGCVLLVAVGAFEFDLHVVHGGWENVVAKQSLNAEALAAKIADVRPYLRFHLLFAVTTPLLWAVTIGLALKGFSNPPLPGPHSRRHKLLGWASAIDVTLTAVTGLIFYYVAFVG